MFGESLVPFTVTVKVSSVIGTKQDTRERNLSPREHFIKPPIMSTPHIGLHISKLMLCAKFLGFQKDELRCAFIVTGKNDVYIFVRDKKWPRGFFDSSRVLNEQKKQWSHIGSFYST